MYVQILYTISIPMAKMSYQFTVTVYVQHVKMNKLKIVNTDINFNATERLYIHFKNTLQSSQAL